MTNLLAAITFSSLFQAAGNVINDAIGVLFVLATAVFLWGVVKYVLAAGDTEALKEGRQYIIYGLIGLFIMFAVWGLVFALTNTFFGQGGNGNNNIPH